MKTGVFVGGEFVDTTNKIVSISPATGEPISEVSLAEGKILERALEEAWKGIGLRPERRKFEKLKEVMNSRADEIAELIAIEQGKPVVEAFASEVYPSLSAVDFLIERGEEILEEKELIPHEPILRGRVAKLIYHPSGVSFVISPWNYPFVIPFLNIVYSLFAGNPVIFRPSSLTPLVGLSIGEIFKEAEFGPWTLQVLITEHNEIESIIRDRRTSNVFFTGSVSVGRRIAQIAGESLKKAILELGGKDVMVVFEDVNLERAASGAAWAGFMNAGQTCASVERVLIQKGVEGKFLDLLKEKTEAIRVGNPLEDNIDMGPLISEEQKGKVLSQIKEAGEEGAIRISGRETEFEKGYYMNPWIFKDVPLGTKLWREETFGPVVAIRSFKTEEEAVNLANDSNYGLTASVWTKDRKRAERAALALEAGSVTINDHLISFVEPTAPWGGFKWSGIGRAHGELGLKESLQPKYILYDFSRRKKLLWWYGYSENTLEILSLTSRIIYGKGKDKLRALFKLLPYVPKLLKQVGFSAILASVGRLLGI